MHAPHNGAYMRVRGWRCMHEGAFRRVPVWWCMHECACLGCMHEGGCVHGDALMGVHVWRCMHEGSCMRVDSCTFNVFSSVYMIHAWAMHEILVLLRRLHMCDLFICLFVQVFMLRMYLTLSLYTGGWAGCKWVLWARRHGKIST